MFFYLLLIMRHINGFSWRILHSCNSLVFPPQRNNGAHIRKLNVQKSVVGSVNLKVAVRDNDFAPIAFRGTWNGSGMDSEHVCDSLHFEDIMKCRKFSGIRRKFTR